MKFYPFILKVDRNRDIHVFKSFLLNDKHSTYMWKKTHLAILSAAVVKYDSVVYSSRE